MQGRKRSKERITASFCVNMEGEFEETLVVGRTEKPRCFENASMTNLPVHWKHNKKAWMTIDIFDAWLKRFDRKMRAKGRLLVDNASSHDKDLHLTNINLQFLPSNSTSRLQPLDQGIIKAIKAHYRKRLMEAALVCLDQGKYKSEVVKSVTVLDACYWLASAVKSVKKTTVKKCFAMSGFGEDILDTDSDENIPLAELVRRTQE